MKVAKQLEAQDDYIAKICQVQREARDQSGKKDKKELALRRILSEKNMSTIPTKGVLYIPFPLQPHLYLSGLNPNTARMFASAVYPCVIDFYEYNLHTANHNGNQNDQQKNNNNSVDNTPERSTNNARSVTASPPLPVTTEPLKSHKIMFKSGDDLRQDQLIMQMISLMDNLLKRVNLDLKLLTYGNLAVSQIDGIMEFVPDSMPISAILKNYNNSIGDYLRVNNPDDKVSSIIYLVFL